MALTTSERKERYYRFVLDRANALCSSWGKRAVRSKQLVVQAKEYAFDKRLKTNISYRFQVLVFTYALELRIAKRYGMLLRKIFHIFAFSIKYYDERCANSNTCDANPRIGQDDNDAGRV